MKTGKKIALVGCSDPLSQRGKEDVRRLVPLLEAEGLTVDLSPLLLRDGLPAPAEKAAEVNRAFRDPGVEYIFDVSGGDLANTVLPYLDFDAIAASKALFFGYSDLTVILNAIVAKTGRPAVNYRIRNLLYDDAEAQLSYFREKILPLKFALSDLRPRFLRGDALCGRVIGGNVRCFLKLAGTPFFPEPDGGILLLESLGGDVYRIITALEQYAQAGVLDRINGILLGTFTHMRDKGLTPTVEELALAAAPPRVAVAVTPFVGHDPNARAILLGKTARFSRDGQNG